MNDHSEQGSSILNKVLCAYYKTPLFSEALVHCNQSGNASGFFRFGPDLVCYGGCSAGVAENVQASLAFDACQTSKISNSEIYLPFDISRIIDNLRMERYVEKLYGHEKRLVQSEMIWNVYYLIREHLPNWARRNLQRAYFRDWRKLPFPGWPVDVTVDSLHEVLLKLAMQAEGRQKVPFIWFWPDGASACLILTHDVETATGRDFTSDLMDIDNSHGFKSSFQVVPEDRYEFSDNYVSQIRKQGFEFNLHDLNHDGHLFKEKHEFLRRAAKINEYVKQYNVQGFRSGAMYRQQGWFNSFDFSYDMSVPNVAHLEPQRGGCCTVMPYFNGRILEIPLTTSQDYTVLQILNESSLDLWKKQIEIILQKNGLVSILAHPDYLIESSSREVYKSLLTHLRQFVDKNNLWAALPGELNRWWRARAAMKLVPEGEGWRIEGPDSDRARIAFAISAGDRIVYKIEDSASTSN